MDKLLYWNDPLTGEVCVEWDKAVELALACLRQPTEAHPDARVFFVEFEEMRPPMVTDIPVELEVVLDAVLERMLEDSFLNHESGGPELDTTARAQASPEGVALLESLWAYVATHGDVSEAGWVLSGRIARVFADGRHEFREQGR